MEWNVYYHDFNAKKIIYWNIFKHCGFTKTVNKLLNQDLTKTEFSTRLEKTLLCYFWAKCEYEVVITSWIGEARDVKTDIYDQVMMNWDRFVDYVWSFRKKKKNERK